MNNSRFLIFVWGLFILIPFSLGSCKKDVKGCTDAKATNFNSSANQDDGTCTYLSIGQQYKGGIIFYIDPSGLHGFVAPELDQSAGVGWDNAQSISTGATGTGMGSGKSNTHSIVTAQGLAFYAAYLCDTLVLNGYNDWFLPSKEELNQLYAQKLTGVLSGFANDVYWSSSEINNFTAWSLDFSCGFINDEKTSLRRVRAIRSF